MEGPSCVILHLKNRRHMPRQELECCTFFVLSCVSFSFLFFHSGDRPTVFRFLKCVASVFFFQVSLPRSLPPPLSRRRLSAVAHLNRVHDLAPVPNSFLLLRFRVSLTYLCSLRLLSLRDFHFVSPLSPSRPVWSLSHVLHRRQNVFHQKRIRSRCEHLFSGGPAVSS